eukprot:PhM_4_TR11574/c0_g1_i1/m.29201
MSQYYLVKQVGVFIILLMLSHAFDHVAAQSRCPRDEHNFVCGGHGTCRFSYDSFSYYCLCDVGWAGADCSRNTGGTTPTPIPTKAITPPTTTTTPLLRATDKNNNNDS